MLNVGTMLRNHYLIVSGWTKTPADEIYLATDTVNGSKCLIWEMGNTPQLQKKLRQELKPLRKSPYFLKKQDEFDENERHFVLLEYVDGITLQEAIEEQGAVSQEDAVKWGLELCEALKQFHACSHELLHCTLQPSGVLLKPDGDIILTGIGMSSSSSAPAAENDTTDAALPFTAPECIKENRHDAASEVYALGALLYFLVTAEAPSLPGKKKKRISELDAAYSGTLLEKLIWQCCQSKPQKRFGNVRVLSRALRKLNQPARGVRRKPEPLALALPAVCAVLVLLLAFQIHVNLQTKIILISAVCILCIIPEIILLRRHMTTPGGKPASEPGAAESIQPETLPAAAEQEGGTGMEQPDLQEAYTSDMTLGLMDEDEEDSSGQTTQLLLDIKQEDLLFDVTEKIIFVHTDVVL